MDTSLLRDDIKRTAQQIESDPFGWKSRLSEFHPIKQASGLELLENHVRIESLDELLLVWFDTSINVHNGVLHNHFSEELVNCKIMTVRASSFHRVQQLEHKQ